MKLDYCAIGMRNKRASDEERMVAGDAGIYCWNF